MSNDGCGDDGGKGGKGGGKGRLGVRRMRWKIERRRREKKDMLFNYLIHISKTAPALAVVQFSNYIYLIHIHVYIICITGEGIGGEGERSEKNAMYVLHVIQNRNLAVDNEVKTPDQVVEKSDRFEDT